MSPHHHPVSPVNRRNARRMRKDLTEAEHKFWNAVRAHRLMGLGFRRQLPINGYIVDFACPAKKLIIEIDGSQHAGSSADILRDESLEKLGWAVLRFWNDNVMRDIDNVCLHIVTVVGLAKPDNPMQTPYAEQTL